MTNRIVICFVLLSVLIAGCAYSADGEEDYPQIRFSNENGYILSEILNKINRQIFEYVVREDYDVFMQETAFFYPMDKDEIEVDVQCELHIIDIFSGNATLQIRKLPDTKLDNYFEIVLTNLQGKCDNHGDIDSPDCEYASDFPIGYFYVDGKNIYMMDHEDEYLDIFKETEFFPPTEEGLEDTYTIQNNYHEFITVDGDVRKYNLYPEELAGTQEYMYITWDHGITYFATWSGNQKLYKSFWVQEK